MGLFTNDIRLDLLGIFTALLAVFFVYIKRSFLYWEQRKVPYSPPRIPWGSLQAPFKRVISFGDEVSNIYEHAKAKGWKYIGIYSMTVPIFMPVDLDLVKSIMTKNFQNFVDRGMYVNEKVQPMSAHLFAIGGKTWKDLRTKLTPTFTSGKMRHMFETMADCGLVLENYMKHEIDEQEPVDIKSILARYSTDIIGSCAFGLECNSFKEPNSQFRVIGEKIFMTDGIRSFKMMFMDMFPAVAKILGMRPIEKEPDEFLTRIVKDTVEYREEKNIKRPDFLQILIDLKNNKNGNTGDGPTITMNEIIAQSFVFFAAGFETSSTTMTFVLYELATHADIQEKVRNEIESVLKKHNNQITYDALSELKYMGQVIDETLRMYPPLSLITRQCVEDYKVPDSDVVIEKGTTVIVSIRGIHYDPENYENPEVFDPERFTEENKQGRHPYAHIPFGEGPRVCIGMRFGVAQTKVGLVSILKNFRVKLSSKTKLPVKLAVDTLVTSTEGGMWLNLEKITR